VGNGSIEDVLRPTRIPITGLPPNAAHVDGQPPSPVRQFIVSVNVGLRHTIVLSSSQLLFGWGMVNLTNATAPSALAPSVGVQAADSSSVGSSSPSHADARRRFSVLCDSTSTSELYLTPTQIFYASGVHNPFSGGKFLQLRGCSSSSLGFVAIDAEVPLALDLGSATKATATQGTKTSPGKAAAETLANSPAKSKLSTTANAVRRALLFTSPTGRSSHLMDHHSIADSSLPSATTSASAEKSVKPQFNPFLKDFSSKKEEQVCLPFAFCFSIIPFS
jgi:hypothetical protein